MIAGPVGLKEVPLLGGAAHEVFELDRHLLGHALDVASKALLPARIDGMTDDGGVVVTGAAVDGSRNKTAPVRSAKVAGPAGSVVRSPK